jgi:toxoflavin synthase
MATTDQFAPIAVHFNNLSYTPQTALLETTMSHYLRETQTSGKRVLDLGCGTGHWSRFAIGLGAKEAVGVDISAAMISSANLLSKTENELKRISYVVADCSKPLTSPDFEQPFDLAVAVCFLNYATNEDEMLGMWQVISTNLRPGAKIIALVPNLNLDDDLSTPIDARYGTSYRKVEDVNVGRPDWGYRTRFNTTTEVDAIEFDMYRLNRGIYEKTAKEAGMGEVRFNPMVFPTEGFGLDYWDEFKRRPHYELLTTVKTG